MRNWFLAAVFVASLLFGGYVTLAGHWTWGVGLVLTTAGVVMCLLFAYADQPLEEDPLVHGRRRR